MLIFYTFRDVQPKKKFPFDLHVIFAYIHSNSRLISTNALFLLSFFSFQCSDTHSVDSSYSYKVSELRIRRKADFTKYEAKAEH